MSPDPTSLDRLHDVIAPAPVPWWPPAPGWYELGGLLLFWGLVLGVHGFASWQANHYRREALREMELQKNKLQEEERREGLVIVMATLLKRAALTAFPREQVATLSGPDWLAFLDRTGRTKAFTEGPGHWLEKIAYDPWCVVSIEDQEVLELERIAKQWLSHHRVELDAGKEL